MAGALMQLVAYGAQDVYLTADHQPSGTCNFSRIDNVNLDITPIINPENTTNRPLQLSVYAFSYNVLRVASGMGGLAFSN
jgi:hypothetical protein